MWPQMGRSDRNWMLWLLGVMSGEKIVQHVIVTWALLVDLDNLRQDVAVDYQWLVVVGGTVGILFGVALVGLFMGQRWSLTLLSGLALIDVIGEFVAQGTVAITVTVSFVVALAILGLSLNLAKRAYPKSTGL
jgi:hypothetical protein